MLFYSLYALSGVIAGCIFLFNFDAKATIIFFALLILSLLGAFFKKIRGHAINLTIFFAFSIIGLAIIYNCSKSSVYTESFVTLCGRISEIPYETDSGYCYTVNTKTLQYGNISVDFCDRVTIYSKNKYNLDDTVSFSGFLKKHERAKNPGCFDSYLYYKSVGINYKMTAYSDSISTEKIYSYSPYSIAQRIRNFYCERSDYYFSENNSPLIKHILAGFKKDENTEFSELLINSGVSRCLYSPYYHLVLILLFVNLITKKASAKVRRRVMYTMCIIYLLINPYHPTAQKLFMLTLITTFIKAHSEISRPLDILFLTILICLMKNPYMIYNEGFLMSCIITCLINAFYKNLYSFMLYVTRKAKASYLISIFLISSVMGLTSAAYLFNGTSLYSIFVSIILLPLILAICILSFLIPVPVLGKTVVFFIDPVLTFIRNLPQAVLALPFSHITMIKPPIILVIASFILLGAIKMKKFRKTLLLIFTGLILAFGLNEALRASDMTITFLNVGQGDCSLIDIPYKATILIDGGGAAEYNTNYDVGKRDVLPYLKYKGITKLDYVFISHYHKDHVDGIVSLIQNIKINNIFLPDCLKENEYRVIIEESAKKEGIKLHYINEPETIKLKNEILAQILYFDKTAKEENDTSLVMRISYNDFSCLYTGDITENIENELKTFDISADILKAPHHGSATSNTLDFIQKVNPKYAIASFDMDNNYGILSRAVKENYKNAGVPLLTTAELGTIQITKTDGRIQWQKKMQ